MSFHQFVVILLARKKIAFFAFFLTIIATFAISMLLPKSYESTATLIVNFKGADPVTGLVLPAQLMPSYMATQVEILSSLNVAMKVVDELSLDQSPTAIDAFNKATNQNGEISEWLGGVLLKNLNVTPSRESNIIKVSYRGSEPQFSAVVTNAFSEAYIQTNLQLKIEPSVRAADWFSSQVTSLRSDLVSAQRKLSSYQKDNGIVSLDKRLDVENSRLVQLSNQLVAAQAEAFDSYSRMEEADNAVSISENPDILKNPLIINMKADLARAEANLAEVRQKLNTRHPDYQSALAEVINLRSKLNNELMVVTKSLASVANISELRVTELEKSLEQQKQRILQINQQRDEMSILNSDVENAQKTLDIAMQRFSQTSMEGQANQSDVMVLNPAIPALEPSSPNLILNMILSIMVGGVLSVSLALFSELVDRRIRSLSDVNDNLSLPVIGSINYRIPKQR